tara:strand:- start:58 stop:555 length:498 start_codon:yes stop_codon:yes gene_type:complete
MSTLHQIREGLNEALGAVTDGWQKLYHRAAGALTHFSNDKKSDDKTQDSRDMEVRSSSWGVLAAEVFDDNDKIVVRLEAPGMEKDDFDLQVHDGYLVVCGEKQIERERTEGNYHVTECAYGRFERAIPLPDGVDITKSNANYKNGVLRVELQKSDLRPRKTIQVN